MIDTFSIQRRVNGQIDNLIASGAVSQLDSRTTIAEIIKLVAARFQVSPAEIVGRGRLKSVFEARASAMWIARQEGYSLTQIGRAFGNRDHTTVMNAIRKIDAAIEGAVE